MESVFDEARNSEILSSSAAALEKKGQFPKHFFEIQSLFTRTVYYLLMKIS